MARFPQHPRVGAFRRGRRRLHYCAPAGAIARQLLREAVPAARGAIFKRIRGIDLLEVKVLLVGAENRKAPGNLLIVSEGNTWQARLTGSDHVPPGSNQVNHVAQRRNSNDPMRIVSQERLAGCSQLAGDGPVIAALNVVSRKFDSCVTAHQVAKQGGGKTCEIDARCGIEHHPGIQVEQL